MLWSMERKDFRRIGRDAQEALRERAVYLVLREAKTQAEAARLVGGRRQVVNRRILRHRDKGAAGLRDGRRISSRKGRGILTAAEARRGRGFIANKRPDRLQLPFAPWTAEATRELIHKKFGKTLGLSTMRLYLKRRGFSSRKPLTPAARAAIRKRSRPGFDRIIHASRRGRSARRRRSTGATRPASTTRISLARVTPRKERRRS